jgi:hypothetical protein
MKEIIGGPGTVSGLLLRIGQCVFAAASISIMTSAIGFSSYTSFWYLFFQPFLFMFYFFMLLLLLLLFFLFVIYSTVIRLLIFMMFHYVCKELECPFFALFEHYCICNWLSFSNLHGVRN